MRSIKDNIKIVTVYLFLLNFILIKADKILKESKLQSCDVVDVTQIGKEDEHLFECESELGLCLTGFLEYDCDATNDRGFATINGNIDNKVMVDTGMTTCQTIKFKYQKLDKEVKLPIIAYCREPVTGKSSGPIADSQETSTTEIETPTTTAASQETNKFGQFDVKSMIVNYNELSCCKDKECDTDYLEKYEIIMGISGEKTLCFAEGMYKDDAKIIVLDYNEDVIFTNKTLDSMDQIKMNVIKDGLKFMVSQETSDCNRKVFIYYYILFTIWVIISIKILNN